MSGGHFDHKQYWINDIADTIERELNRQGKEKKNDQTYWFKEYFQQHPEELFYPTYSYAVQEKMREAVKQLRIAYVYVQRLDWFLSGDDSEESFIERLNEELKTIDNMNI